MGVIDLEQVLLDRLVPGIAIDLAATGVSIAEVSEVDDVARWRRAARLAGRQLGWSVRTGVSKGRVWVASEDYEPHWNADREAARRLAALIFTPGRHRSS